MPFEIALSKMDEETQNSNLTVNPGRVWWTRDIIDGRPGVPLVQGVNHIGNCTDQGCLSGVVIVHEWEVRDGKTTLLRDNLTYIARLDPGPRE